MKLGKDFWFWVRLIIAIFKAILGFQPTNSNPELSAGHRAFNAVLSRLVSDNQDDDHTPADFNTLLSTDPAQPFLDVTAELTKPAKPNKK